MRSVLLNDPVAHLFLWTEERKFSSKHIRNKCLEAYGAALIFILDVFLRT